MMNEKYLQHNVWLLHGLTSGERGVLRLKNEPVSFETDTERMVFDAALSQVSEIKFPWLYFAAGMILKIGEEKFRLSFIQPGNSSLGEHASIPDARAGQNLASGIGNR